MANQRIIKTGNFTVSEFGLPFGDNEAPTRYQIGVRYDFTRVYNGMTINNLGTAIPAGDPLSPPRLAEPFIRYGFAGLVPDQGALYNTAFKGARPKFWIPLEFVSKSYTNSSNTGAVGVLPGAERDHASMTIQIDQQNQIFAQQDPGAAYEPWTNFIGANFLPSCGFAINGEINRFRFVGPDEGVYTGQVKSAVPRAYSISTKPDSCQIPGVGPVVIPAGLPVYNNKERDFALVFDTPEGATAFMRTLTLKGVVDFGRDSFQ